MLTKPIKKRDRFGDVTARVASRPVSAVGTARARVDGWLTDVGRRVDASTAELDRIGTVLWGRWEQTNLLRRWAPRLLFGVLFIWYFVTFERLVWMRHSNFGTFDYDLGMYDQGVWLLSRGRQFMTVRGMKVFGHHANIGYLLFVPAYWLGFGGAQFLDIMNTLGVMLVTIPLFALGRRHLRSDWAGLLLAAIYLFHFVPQWMIQETFHPENLAAPFLVGAFYFASASRWRAYWWCVAFALIWKEDVGLYVLMMGVVVLLLFRARRVGVFTMIAGALWFLVATKAIIPFFSPEGAVFDNLFGALGASANAVVINSIRHPTLTGRILADHKAEEGALRIIRPYGYVPLGAPLLFLMGLPQHLVNFLSIQNFTWNPQAHYVMLPFTSVTLAGVRTVVTRTRVWLSWGLIAVMAIGVASTQDQGVGPWTQNGKAGFWPTTDSPRNVAIRKLMKKIPDDAIVSTSYFILPHMSHRPEIYTFPNPWRSQNFGVHGETRNPARIQYVLLNRDPLQGEDKTLFEQILASNEFDVLDRIGDLYLLKRKA